MKSPFLILVFISAFFISESSFAQPENFDSKKEMARLTYIPNSPEAQAFDKYGNVSVNMHHGTPNIQVPIYTHNGRELNLPINLSYDASGIKVEQVASQIGLAWNLNVGGRVSRVVNGFPDDFYSAGTNQQYFSFWDDSDGPISQIDVNARILEYSQLSPSPSFSTKPALVAYYRFLFDMNENKYDTQPDYFSFNALGYSDTFVIDVASRTARSLSNPRTKVECIKTFINESKSPIQGWKVTTEDGTEFYFNHRGNSSENDDGVEITQSQRDDDNSPNYYGFSKKYNSSWLLTKIISATQKDTYEFFYTHEFNQKANMAASNFVGVKNIINDPANSFQNPNVIQDNLGYDTETYTIQQRMLSSIKHNGKIIIKVDATTNRYDILNKAVDKIHLYNNDTGIHANDLFKSYDFQYGYFRTTDEVSEPYSANNIPFPGNVRLKLKALDILDKNESYVSSYYFNYIKPCKIASLASKGQDYYGYYNGGDGQTVLYPTYQDLSNGINLTGNPRNINSNYTQNGTLNKITYPTGGSTEFIYEPHHVPEVVGTQTVWISELTAQINNPSIFPTLDLNACNAHAPGSSPSEITPVSNIQSFSVPQGGNTYKATVSSQANGGGSVVLFSPQQTAFIIKVDDPGVVLTWQDIFDSSCNPLSGIDVVWAHNGMNGEASISEIISLNEGDYKMVLSNPSSDLSYTLDLEKVTSAPLYDQIKKAGIRVKEIKDYTSDNVLATHKSYSYPLGYVISDPIHMFLRQEPMKVDAVSYEIGTVMYRISYASNTSKPHVGYTNVNETINDNINSENNISTTHTFFNAESGSYKNGIYSYYINEKETAKQYGGTYYLGKPNKTTTSSTEGYSVLSSNSYSTFHFSAPNEQIESVKGLYVLTDEVNSQYYPYPLQSPNGNWSVDLTVAQVIPTYGGTQFGYQMNNVLLAPPDDCQQWGSGNANDLCTPVMARSIMETADAWQTTGNLIKSTATKDYEASGEILEQETQYKYYGNAHKYLVNHQTSFTSDGGVITSSFKYPENFSGTQYQSLRDNNIISRPVETEVSKNGNTLSVQNTEFDGGLVPKRIKTAKGNNDFESRVEFEEYRDNNLVQARQYDGTPVTYVWGYDDRYVVAKVENATYDQIKSLSNFGNGSEFTIPEGLTPAQESQLQTLPKAQVTTYEYDPVIGVTKITDANNQSVNYNYDHYQRLEQIRDKNDALLKRYDYNYRPTTYAADECDPPPNNDPLTANGMEVIVDNSTNVPYITYSTSIFGLQGGTPGYNYTWRCYPQFNINYVALGSGATATLQYSANDSFDYCGNYDPEDLNTQPPNIIFECIITDSANPENTITVTKTVQATCHNDHQ